MRDCRDPMPATSATRTNPVNARHSSRHHHSRCVSQSAQIASGIRSNSAKKAPCGNR